MDNIVGAVCENGHIRDVERDVNELSENSFCRKCGEKLHRICPNCEQAPVLIDKRSRDDGSISWHVTEYCHRCGEAFPWGPSRLREVARAIDKHIPEVQNNSPTPNLFTNSQRQYLEQLRYGQEVVKHVREGDRCYRYSLWHSALTSYIHAFEWAAIAYLEHEHNIDIIQKEQDGMYYNFAGGSNNILDELTDHAEIDQKTLSKLKSLNRAERRWMAHHKSGETLQDEVDGVRSRLSEFVGTLFPNETAKRRTEDEEEESDN